MATPNETSSSTEAVARNDAKLGSRELFPDLAAAAYLNYAALPTLSLPVRESIDARVRDYASRGAERFFAWYDRRSNLKEKLAPYQSSRTCCAAGRVYRPNNLDEADAVLDAFQRSLVEFDPS